MTMNSKKQKGNKTSQTRDMRN